jgi:uncharacterized protein (TIGR02147 family)
VNKQPDVFSYTDFRHYLRDYHAYLKGRDRKFSHRYIAQKVGAGSAGWFANILKGRINLTQTYVHALIKFIGLRSIRAEFFELMVKCNQAGSLDEQNYLLQRLFTLKGTSTRIVRQDQFEFYSTWYISAIRELLFFYDFRGDYTALGKKLNPSISPQEAERAMRVLWTLGFIHNDANGYPRPSHPVVSKDASIRHRCWRDQMQAKIALGARAMDSFSPEDRDISEVFVPLSSRGFAEARDEIMALRKKLLALSERDSETDKVYQCSIQFFPLSN